MKYHLVEVMYENEENWFMIVGEDGHVIVTERRSTYSRRLKHLHEFYENVTLSPSFASRRRTVDDSAATISYNPANYKGYKRVSNDYSFKDRHKLFENYVEYCI